MHIDKIENKLKQEITLCFVGLFDKENIFMCDKAIKDSINSIEWEKIIIDFNKTEDIDVEAIKLLWETKDIANSKQKAFEFKNVNGKVAIAFKFLGFTEKFNIDVNIDENIVNKVIMLGEYEEPLYESRMINKDIYIKNKTILLDVMSDFVDEVNKKFDFEVKEWAIIPESLKNKLIFLLETNNIPDIEKAEEYLNGLIIDKYGIESSLYILENGTFNEFYKMKKRLGIPNGVALLPRVIRNPYTQQYFLGKIDERY